MTYRDSALHFEEFFKHLSTTFLTKGGEYKVGEADDRLAHFYQVHSLVPGYAGNVLQTIATLKAKHTVCINELIRNPRTAYDKAYLLEKFGDEILYTILEYLYLLEGLEQRNKEVKL